jgi:hypothetical protein
MGDNDNLLYYLIHSFVSYYVILMRREKVKVLGLELVKKKKGKA